MTNLQDSFQTISQVLGWALLHSLWQGFLLFGLLWVILKLVPTSSAKLRYRLGLLALAGIAAWFVYTAAGYWQSMQHYTVTISTQANSITWQQSVKQDTMVIGAQVVRWLAPLEDQLPALVAIYLLGVAALFARLIYNIAGIRSLTSKRVQPPTEDWLTLLRNCAQQLGITKQVRLLFSERISVPMITGTLKPVILVPLAMITRLDTYQAEAILLHELAHIRRQDYLVNIIQAIVETILFFNPFVWAVSSIIRREREHCCDDIVLEHTQWPVSYAHALTTLETYRQNPLAMAATGSRNQLLHRIKRMMEMNRNTISYGPVFTVSLTVLLAVSFIWLTPVLAQDKKDQATETAAPAEDSSKVSRKERIIIKDPNGTKRVYNSIDEVPEEDRKKFDLGAHKDEEVVIKKTVVKQDGEEEEMIDIEKTIEEALNGVDWNQVNKDVSSAMVEVQTAMKDIDWAQISADTKAAMEEAKKAMAEVDWNKISADTKAAMEESKKAMEEANKAIAEIDWKKINAGTDAAIRETEQAIGEMKKELAETNWTKDNAEYKKTLEESQKALEASVTTLKGSMHGSPGTPTRSARVARVLPPRAPRAPRPPLPPQAPVMAIGTGGSYERMLDKMDADGLIDRDRKYKIEKKSGALYINDKKQPDATYRKYSRYLAGESVTIKGSKGSLDIKVRNGK